MAILKYISIDEFANFHQVTTQLILEFAEFGLIEVKPVNKKTCIVSENLDKCERAIRLYRDLGVNKEGIEIILEMRQKHLEMQQELTRLKHQINKYEVRTSQLFSDEFLDID